VPRVPVFALAPLRVLILSGVAALALAGCAINSTTTTTMRSPDYSGLSRTEVQSSLDQLSQRYKSNPKDKGVAINYAAALRQAGQSGQAVSVLEASMAYNKGDLDVRVAYAKALSAEGRFDQALNVIDDAIRPESPDWNALSVKGAILDQSGRNEEARALYTQALTIAPAEAGLEANLGLSFAMTNELDAAEAHLRKAVQMRGATSQIRQNLALVVGLQGRFEECRAMFARELAPDQVEANMAYIRALLTQQNRWDTIENGNG
jgi:Flp pilus assembly protein TadD